MFVLMDIEWIENRIHHICPTQIAAMRVDEQWHCLDLFYSRIRDRNIDQINRTQYQYLYIDSSRVFHRRGCSAILSTSEAIKGSVYYDGCASTGRQPCKLCCPTPGTWLSATQKHTAKRKTTELKVSIPDRTMNTQQRKETLTQQCKSRHLLYRYRFV